MKGNMINQVNKKLITNTTAVIFDLLAQIGEKRLTNAVSNYLMCAEYQVFRAIYVPIRAIPRLCSRLTETATKT